MNSKGGIPQIPGYDCLERLGVGGQASVFKGIQKSMNRPVAIKVIRAGSEAPETEIGRFMREARVLAKLRHDNIVQAIDYGEHEGTRYLVMEFVEGESVLDLMKVTPSLGVVRSTEIALHVARALEHAAKFDVMHRDVKPANIVITTTGKAILVDFGLAKPGDSDLQVTMAGMTVGTPHYMPPEQIRGESELDIRVDIYALGGTYYHMLTGVVPFDRETKAQILISHLRDPVVLPEFLPEPIPDHVFDIVKKAMKKKQDMRYQNASEMVADLEASLDILKGTGSGPILQAVPSNQVVAPVSSRGRSGRGTPVRAQPAPTPAPLTAALEERVRLLTNELEQETARTQAVIKERDDLKAQLAAARASLERIRASAKQPTTLANGPTSVDSDRVAKLERELVEVRKKAEAEIEALRRERDRALKEWQAEERRARKAAEEYKSELAMKSAPAEGPPAADDLGVTDVRIRTFNPPPAVDELAATDVRIPVMSDDPPLAKPAREAPMTYVNRGYFIAGEDEGQDVETPRHQAHLPSFWVDIYPVTNRHYAEYVQETGALPPQHWKNGKPAPDGLDHPVVWVTWQDAEAYAKWCGKRLPTLLEWQKASRGSDGRHFPWGDEMDPARLNCKESGIGTTTPATRYEHSGSPFGMHDAAGNVAEWVDGQFNIPGVQATGQVVRAVCGGSFRDVISRSRCASRRGYPDGGKAPFVGFRCARDS